MSLALLYSRAHAGINAPLVSVEVHLSNGLPAFNIVGMAETAVKESRDRVRSAIINSQLEFPARRITVNLAPADLPKQGGQFDLAIALGILVASDQIDGSRLKEHEFVAELALTGATRPVRGVLPAAIACGRDQRQLVCSPANQAEAMLSDTPIRVAESLLSVCAHLQGQQPLELATPIEMAAANSQYPDLSEVKGQSQAKRALEIAAAGGHHLLLYGPPGTGKSMLASRMPGLLPPLSRTEAIEVASVQSLVSAAPLQHYPPRPFCAPHHTASATALVGGGSTPTPGEISLAHHGVLFLDELPEFQRQVLEVLREPLETGQIRISRAAAQQEFPANFQLIAAMNPCPCGYFGDYQGARTCRCTPDQIHRYRGKISGPLLDRIDLQVPVQPLARGELYGDTTGESSQQVGLRVTSARQRQLQRQGKSNQRLSGKLLHQHCPLTSELQQMLENAMVRFHLSARAMNKCVKVARTIADLEQTEHIAPHHITEALSYRPLSISVRP